MRATSKVIFCCLVSVLAMSFGASSHAQSATPEKPAEQPATLNPWEKAIPADLTADLNVSFYSKYVWRGLELSKDSLVIFPSATIGYKGFAFNAWVDLDTHFDNPPPGEDKEFTLQETDITLTYTNNIDMLKMGYTLGWVYYDTNGFYGDTFTSNQEIFVTLAFDVILKPTLSIYNEIQTGEARYVLLALSHSFNVYKDWSLDVGGSVSYLYVKQEDFSDMHDGNLGAGLTIPLTQYCSVTPKIQYSFPLTSDASDRIEASSFDGDDDQFVYGGVILDLEF